MFKIYDGREHFWQWDLNQKLIVEDPEINEVHFCNRTDDCSLVVEVYEYEGMRVADVPNVLLQDDWKIKVYAYSVDHTKHEASFKVATRSKPADYIYTETETKTWDDLEKKINDSAVPYAPTVNIWELDEGIYRIAGGFQWGQYEPPVNPRYTYITSGLLIVSVETRINDTRVYTVIADNKIYYGKSTPFEVINVDTGKKEVHVDGTIDYIEKTEKIDNTTTAQFCVPTSGAVKDYVDAAVAKSGISEVPSNYIWELESGVYHVSQPIFYSQNLEGDQELIFCKDAYIVITIDDFKHRRSFRLFAEDGKVYYGYSEPHLVNTDNGTKTIVYSELETLDLNNYATKEYVDEAIAAAIPASAEEVEY